VVLGALEQEVAVVAVDKLPGAAMATVVAVVWIYLDKDAVAVVVSVDVMTMDMLETAREVLEDQVEELVVQVDLMDLLLRMLDMEIVVELVVFHA
jgi:hypothetical protein